MKTQKIKKTIKFGSEELTIDIGTIAVQAYGSVEVRYQDNVVLSTTCYKKHKSDNATFLALSVNYLEKYYAVGRIPGGFVKREGRPSDSEILISRIIDRSIRPTLPDDFLNETQIISTLLSYGNKYKSDVCAMIASSISAAISGLPLKQTVTSCRIGKIGDDYIINPSIRQMEKSNLDLFVSYTRDSVLMIECEGKEVSDEEIISAIEFGKKESLVILDLIDELVKELKVEKISYEGCNNDEIISIIEKDFISEIQKCSLIGDKISRYEAIDNLKIKIKTELDLKLEKDVDSNKIEESFKSVFKRVMRSKIIKDKVRIDGRGLDDIRDISIISDYLPKENVHGSALFSRGETQVLGVCTLGSTTDAQTNDSVTKTSDKDFFLLHYNFPPFSVNEVSALKGTGRREIGHGNLAKKAILPMIPSIDSFDYTIRSVCEVVSCNGSSSMGSVSAASLSLMCAGVPLKSHVAGIAIGLIQEGSENLILTDIMADEDFLGDIDFKVAGTKNGITALQMDVKIDSLSIETLKEGLKKGQIARSFIIDKMDEAVCSQKRQLNSSIPSSEIMEIKKGDIPVIIGKQGSTIKGITADSAASISIDDSKMIVKITGNSDQISKAREMISDLLKKKVEENESLNQYVSGNIYTGKILKTNDFGIIVEVEGFSSVMVHYKDLKIDQYSLKKVRFGNEVSFKFLEKDNNGRSKVTISDVEQKDSNFIEFLNNNKFSSENRSNSRESSYRSGGGKKFNSKSKQKGLLRKILDFLKV